MAGKYLDLTGLAYFWEKIKQLIPRLSKKTQSIPFGQVDSTSTATEFTATIDGIDELRDGICCYLRNGVVTSASGWTLNINGLGAKPVYQTMADASRTTTIFNINYTFLFVYNSTRVENGCWDVYYGYNSNDDYRAYQVRTNSSTLPAKFKTYGYRLLFTSADGNYYVGANASTSTNATNVRTPTTEKIDPFGRIVYYATTTAVNADADFSTSYLYQQSTFTLGYSFNSTGGALVLEYPKPVYIKCAPQTNGSAIIDADNPYVQALPEEEDGKIYIFLGFAHSETSVELTLEHPIYYYQDGAIRLWTNQSVQDVSNKADKVVGATSGNFAGLNVSGNLTDSGSKASDFATSTHTHGNITNIGALQTSDITIASGDKLVVTDTSNSGKIARTSISFDGTTTNTALTPKGTFERFLQSSDLNTYWANQQLTSEAVYNTEPEFKTVTINGSTNSSIASTENVVLLYDTEEKCIKFMFN